MAEQPLWIRPSGLIALLVCAGMSLPAGAATAAAATMSFCVDQGNPLYKIDRTVAAAAAKAAGQGAAFTVFDSTSTPDSLKAQKPGYFVNLAARCDLVMGFPVEKGYPTIPEGLLASRPYAVTGFVLAANGAKAPRFSAMPAHARIGASYLSVPSTWFGDHPDLDENVYDTPAELYQALRAKQIDAALIWQPWLVHELSAHPAAVATRPLRQPHAGWNVVALYRPGTEAASRFNAAIGTLETSGRLAALIQPYAVPQP